MGAILGYIGFLNEYPMMLKFEFCSFPSTVLEDLSWTVIVK